MSDLVKASETVGRLCDRIEQLERELEKWRDIAGATESLKQQYAEMLTAEKALADRLAEIIKNCDVSTGYCCCGDHVDSHGMGSGHSPVDEGAYQSEKALAAYRKARGL